jgi:archaellum component FlaC
MDSLVGTQIGHYRLERVLASGGMAAVLEAVHVAHGQRVAVKVLRRDLRRSIDPIARLVQEGRVICSLLHEHIVRVFDYGTADESIAFIVMELLQGRTLAGLLDQERRLAPNRAAFIARQLCDGLHAAHARGVFHRDIKPANIFLVDGQRHRDFVKVLDFGIAKLDSTDPGKLAATATGMTLGTPEYMSPEQATAATIDARSDVYQVGVVLFEMLTGNVPFRGRNPVTIMQAHLTTLPPDVRSVDPEIPAALAEVVARCLAKSPDARFPDARVLAQVLDRFAETDVSTPALAGGPDDFTATVVGVLRLPVLGNRGDVKRYSRGLDASVRKLWPAGNAPVEVRSILDTVARLREASGELEMEVAARRADADDLARTLEARLEPIERAVRSLSKDREAAQRALAETVERVRRLEERVRVLDSEYAEVYERLEQQQNALYQAAFAAESATDFRGLYREGIDTDMRRLASLHTQRTRQAEPLERERAESLKWMRTVADLQNQITQLEISRLNLEAERSTRLAERELLKTDAEMRAQSLERALEHQNLELGLALRQAMAVTMGAT